MGIFLSWYARGSGLKRTVGKFLTLELDELEISGAEMSGSQQILKGVQPVHGEPKQHRSDGSTVFENMDFWMMAFYNFEWPTEKLLVYMLLDLNLF